MYGNQIDIADIKKDITYEMIYAAVEPLKGTGRGDNLSIRDIANMLEQAILILRRNDAKKDDDEEEND